MGDEALESAELRRPALAAPPHVDRDVLAGQVCHAYVAQRIDEAAAFNYIESSGRPT
ncbi:hypothetical protein ACIBBE_36340 [Streptomyces sp. NPDC051644]|uniref:hypothetical protein n=1 Tax=Streptomyces sp. NPDC051644 TaxID=3365666 RepID=UPI0037B670E8